MNPSDPGNKIKRRAILIKEREDLAHLSKNGSDDWYNLHLDQNPDHTEEDVDWLDWRGDIGHPDRYLWIVKFVLPENYPSSPPRINISWDPPENSHKNQRFPDCDLVNQNTGEIIQEQIPILKNWVEKRDDWDLNEYNLKEIMRYLCNVFYEQETGLTEEIKEYILL